MSKFKPQYRRLLHIDRTIRAGEYPNCSSLAREWEISSRTMQRDIDYLKYELDAPIEYDPLKRGFYYADPSWFLPSVILSEGELLALLIGREALNMYRGTPVAGQLEQVYGKLAELLPDQISLGPEFIQTRFSFFNAPSRTMDPAIWKVILRGLLRQQVVDITYRSPSAPRPKPHRLHPYHVLNLEGEWYLLAHNERWDGLRQYALLRVKTATLTEQRFSMPEGFDIKDALQARFGRYLHHDGKKTATVVKLSIASALAKIGRASCRERV